MSHSSDLIAPGNPDINPITGAMISHELLDMTSCALLASLRSHAGFVMASEAILDGDEFARDALREQCAFGLDPFDILEQLVNGESVSPDRLAMSAQRQAAFGAFIGDRIWRIYFKLPPSEHAQAGTLLAGCLLAEARMDNPAVSKAVRAASRVTYDKLMPQLTVALEPPRSVPEPDAQPMPPLEPNDRSTAPLPETPLREPPTTPVQQRSPVFEDLQSPLRQPVLQPAKPLAPVTALLAPLFNPPLLPAAGSTPAAGSARSPAPQPPPSPPTLATGQPVPGLHGPADPPDQPDPPVSSTSSSWNLLLFVMLNVATLTFCFALLSALTYVVIPACALVATLPSTRPSLLSSCARVTFFIVTSGITVRKRERPPRPRDKEES